MTDAVPPLRRDAERNRQLLLRAAYELMAVNGLNVPYEDIARAAGTGMGTMYRRFPQRQDLLDALFSEHIDTVIQLAEQAAGNEDAWAGLAWFLERQLEIEAQSRGLGELLRSRSQATALVQRAHERMTPLVAGLIARAVRAGQLPPGATPADFAAAHVMVGSVMDASRDHAPRLWRRALAVALAGLRHADLPGDPPDETAIDLLYNDHR
ncbi:TetR family transcriptional regulator [Actinoplanes cyaneus]|uniref:TetR family transcriptional regulator n=1 Tax=Actinoplanes cyaneus TaxID=52696 RepID=A0A919ILZ3_9ACTN|nr:TetR/AcrR family transcriptional regulator [Actinoplanes cyaneus]MCW2141890.1 transcriptional regulator, TetR family [Actinoplanes cyaneus]GID68505.1 TetR family transcriptional regulator [Actinoplanes cyaneus]